MFRRIQNRKSIITTRESSISEAGEVANVEYTVPPLTLLNQPVKQQSTSKAEVQRKGQVLESTMKTLVSMRKSHKLKSVLQ